MVLAIGDADGVPPPSTSCLAPVAVDTPDTKHLSNRSSRARRQDLVGFTTHRRGGAAIRMCLRCGQSRARTRAWPPRSRRAGAAAPRPAVARCGVDDGRVDVPALPVHDLRRAAARRAPRGGAAQALRLRGHRDGARVVAGRGRAGPRGPSPRLCMADDARLHERVADAAPVALCARRQLRADRDGPCVARCRDPRARGARVHRRRVDAVMAIAVCSSVTTGPPRWIGDVHRTVVGPTGSRDD